MKHSETWFASDTHFSHRRIVEFVDDGGNVCRPHPEENRPFKNSEEHDEYLIQKWNECVNPKDRVYHLGDFCMAKRGLEVFNRLNGRIHLILGNHDVASRQEYEEYKNIDYFGGMVNLPKLGWVLTHCPVHTQQLEHRWKYNIHGHTHSNNVMKLNASGKATKISDERYINVSMEQIKCKPIHIDEIKNRCD